VKRRVIVLAGIAIIVAASSLWINDQVARHSVPTAVYMTLLPIPFQFEGSFRSGKVQGVVVGDDWRKSVNYLISTGRCSALLGDKLVEADQLQAIDEGLIDRNGRIIFRCKGGGTVWNLGLVVNAGKIVEIGLAGGMWTP